MDKEKIEKAFSIFNGGEGLDHWSYSSTSTPLAKNLIGYTFPQEVRRTFAFRYKANFGNLVNNVVQRMIADVIYKSKTIKQDKFTEEERSYQNCFNKELPGQPRGLGRPSAGGGRCCRSGRRSGGPTPQTRGRGRH